MSCNILYDSRGCRQCEQCSQQDAWLWGRGGELADGSTWGWKGWDNMGTMRRTTHWTQITTPTGRVLKQLSIFNSSNMWAEFHMLPAFCGIHTPSSSIEVFGAYQDLLRDTWRRLRIHRALGRSWATKRRETPKAMTWHGAYDMKQSDQGLRGSSHEVWPGPKACQCLGQGTGDAFQPCSIFPTFLLPRDYHVR